MKRMNQISIILAVLSILISLFCLGLQVHLRMERLDRFRSQGVETRILKPDYMFFITEKEPETDQVTIANKHTELVITAKTPEAFASVAVGDTFDPSRLLASSQDWSCSWWDKQKLKSQEEEQWDEDGVIDLNELKWNEDGTIDLSQFRKENTP